MELNWSTFLLEILNFLVLLWLLKRFFYKPVLAAIARRQASIQQEHDDANRLRTEAETLEKQYRSRVDDWQREREKAREALQAELDAERKRQRDALKAELADERAKADVLAERALAKERQCLESTALQQAATFASRLLADLANPPLEASLAERLLADLAAVPAERWETLRQSWATPPASITVRSAFPLDTTVQQRITQCLHEKTGLTVPVTAVQDPTLLAGIEIDLGAWVLQANLRDELKLFADLARHD